MTSLYIPTYPEYQKQDRSTTIYIDYVAATMIFGREYRVICSQVSRGSYIIKVVEKRQDEWGLWNRITSERLNRKKDALVEWNKMIDALPGIILGHSLENR